MRRNYDEGKKCDWRMREMEEGSGYVRIGEIIKEALHQGHIVFAENVLIETHKATQTRVNHCQLLSALQ